MRNSCSRRQNCRSLLEPKLQRRGNHDDGKQNPTDGRGVTHFEVLKPVVLEVVHHGRRAYAGSARRQNIRLDEHLKGRDEGHHHPEKDGWRQQGKRDPPKSSPRLCPVNGGRLVQRARARTQPGREDRERRVGILGGGQRWSNVLFKNEGGIVVKRFNNGWVGDVDFAFAIQVGCPIKQNKWEKEIRVRERRKASSSWSNNRSNLRW